MAIRILQAILSLSIMLSPIAHAQDSTLKDEWKAEEFRQFDFWIGEWDVLLRMIQPDNTWRDSVGAKVNIHRILDGKAILELWDSGPIKGFSLRYFDPEQKKWMLYLSWPRNNASSISQLAGEFRHGRGEFYSGPALGDASARISRYTFCDITPNSLRWDDAFSGDGGKNWRNNWIMEFSRTAPASSWPKGVKALTFDKGERCVGAAYDAINSLAGEWEGEVSVAGPKGEETHPAKMKVYHVLDGCSVMRFLSWGSSTSQQKSFALLTYNQEQEQYMELSLDNKPSSPAQIHTGKLQGKQFSLTRAVPGESGAMVSRRQWDTSTADGQITARWFLSPEGQEEAPFATFHLSKVETK